MLRSRCCRLLLRESGGRSAFLDRSECVRLPERVNVPSPPIVMPSDTPMVLYCHASILSFWTCFLISFPRSNTKLSSVYQVEHLQPLAYLAPKACADSQCMLRYRQYYKDQLVELTDLHGLPSHQTLAIPTWGCVFIASRDGTPAA
jgi:hypothetical protein